MKIDFSDSMPWAIAAGIRWLLLGWISIGLLGQPSWAQADSPIEARVSDEYTYSFAQHIQFAAEFTSSAPIAKVNLLFAEKGDPHILTIDLSPPSLQNYYKGSYVLDLRANPLRPFAPVEFWWYVEDTDGRRLETEKVEFIYQDNRYRWRRAAGDRVHVYWVSDDPALGHTAVRIAKDGLDRIAPLLPNKVTETAKIYIYPSNEELGAALRLSNRDWVGGQADPEWGVILTSYTETSASNGLEQFIPHEIAHFAIYHSTGGKTSQAPAWLHEGLATLNENRPNPAYSVILEDALENDTLDPFVSLCTVFPEKERSALQAYAQSISLVRYLQNHYGNQKLSELIAAYGDGADCSGGVERVLGMTLTDLEAEWYSSLTGETMLTVPARQLVNELDDLAVWIGLFIGSTLLSAAFYFLRPRRKDEFSHEQAA